MANAENDWGVTVLKNISFPMEKSSPNFPRLEDALGYFKTSLTNYVLEAYVPEDPQYSENSIDQQRQHKNAALHLATIIGNFIEDPASFPVVYLAKRPTRENDGTRMMIEIGPFPDEQGASERRAREVSVGPYLQLIVLDREIPRGLDPKMRESHERKRQIRFSLTERGGGDTRANTIFVLDQVGYVNQDTLLDVYAATYERGTRFVTVYTEEDFPKGVFDTLFTYFESLPRRILNAQKARSPKPEGKVEESTTYLPDGTPLTQTVQPMELRQGDFGFNWGDEDDDF